MRRTEGTRPLGHRGVLILCALFLALSSCDTFDFYALLSGTGAHAPAGSPLAISPIYATLVPGASCTFTASGGTPPYRFSVIAPGAGTIDSATGVYVAPGATASDTIEVSDAAGGTDDARALVP